MEYEIAGNAKAERERERPRDVIINRAMVGAGESTANERMPEIARFIDQQRGAQEHLLKALSLLEQKLAPVLRKMGPSPELDGRATAEMEPMTKIGAILQDQMTVTRSMAEHVEDILTRLEI